MKAQFPSWITNTITSSKSEALSKDPQIPSFFVDENGESLSWPSVRSRVVSMFEHMKKPLSAYNDPRDSEEMEMCLLAVTAATWNQNSQNVARDFSFLCLSALWERFFVPTYRQKLLNTTALGYNRKFLQDVLDPRSKPRHVPVGVNAAGHTVYDEVLKFPWVNRLNCPSDAIPAKYRMTANGYFGVYNREARGMAMDTDLRRLLNVMNNLKSMHYGGRKEWDSVIHDKVGELFRVSFLVLHFSVFTKSCLQLIQLNAMRNGACLDAGNNFLPFLADTLSFVSYNLPMRTIDNYTDYDEAYEPWLVSSSSVLPLPASSQPSQRKSKPRKKSHAKTMSSKKVGKQKAKSASGSNGEDSESASSGSEDASGVDDDDEQAVQPVL